MRLRQTVKALNIHVAVYIRRLAAEDRISGRCPPQNALANAVGANCEFRDLDNTFLCECKNYDKKVDVTYVGKFCSLMTAANVHFGVMIAWLGVTGEGWKAAAGLIKKIALGEKRYIVVLDRESLKGIYDRRDNLYALLNRKVLALKNDIDYKKLITAHESEEKIREQVDSNNRVEKHG